MDTMETNHQDSITQTLSDTQHTLLAEQDSDTTDRETEDCDYDDLAKQLAPTLQAIPKMTDTASSNTLRRTVKELMVANMSDLEILN